MRHRLNSAARPHQSSSRRHISMRRSLPCAFALAALFPLLGAADDAPWGTRNDDLQSRLTLASPLAKGSPIPITAELRNVSDKPILLTNVRVWIMLAQGPDRVFYTAPSLGPAKITLDPGAQTQITCDAGPLAAYPYDPTLVIQNGLPVPPPGSKAPRPASAGKLTDLLPVGPAKAKAFVVVSLPGTVAATETTTVIPSASVALAIAEADLATLTPVEQQAIFDEIARLFRADAVSAKSGHDRAVKIGTPILPTLIALLQDHSLTDAGRMWLTASLVDLHDAHVVDALIDILKKGGSSAYVVAYMGPKMKDPTMTAAIEKTARATQDPVLSSWAVRGLGLAGVTLDPKMLAGMIAHTDPAGRAEAADILAADKDPRVLPLLAKLFTDDDLAVRIHAAKAAADHRRDEPLIIHALEAMEKQSDASTRAAAEDALNTLTTK